MRRAHENTEPPPWKEVILPGATSGDHHHDGGILRSVGVEKAFKIVLNDNSRRIADPSCERAARHGVPSIRQEISPDHAPRSIETAGSDECKREFPPTTAQNLPPPPVLQQSDDLPEKRFLPLP